MAWTLLDDGDAESIRSEVAAGHHSAACGLLLNRAIELLHIIDSIVATVEEFLTIVVLRRDVPSYLFTLLVLFPTYVRLPDGFFRLLGP